MPFVSSELIQGKIFVPEKRLDPGQKHPCKDCFSCQRCGDDRCQLCLREKKGCFPEEALE
jgi:hypothetical protein